MKCDQYLLLQLILSTLHLNPIFDFGFAFLVIGYQYQYQILVSSQASDTSKSICSPSEANYCSNPFKVFMILLNTIRNFSWEIFLGSSITVKFNEYLICFFQFCKGTVNFNYLFVVISSVKCGLFSAIDGQRWVLAYVSKIQAKYFDYLFNWANQLDNIFTRLLILFTLLSLFNFNIDRD